MRRWQYIVFLILMVLVQACVSSYEADIDDEPALVSIEGSLIKGEEVQRVLVSTSSSSLNPRFNPIAGCLVSVLDEFDAEYDFQEQAFGVYTSAIPDEALVLGRSYMIRVVTPEGEVYESDYEELNRGISVDSVYYRIEDRVDPESGEAYSGLQFYLDVIADEEDSRYFRWRLEETYEYTSAAPITFIYRDKNLIPEYTYDPWEFYRCWISEDVDGIYLSSTMKLALNEKKQISLNYVGNRTDKLKIKYSLLVSQYSLNEPAYNYFEQNRIATQEGNGLYTRQPRQPVTNIRNINDENERVLGYFWVSSVTTHRIFVPRIPELDVYGGDCVLYEFNPEEDGNGPFPAYVYVDGDEGTRLTSAANCFICTKRGGQNAEPDFWE